MHEQHTQDCLDKNWPLFVPKSTITLTLSTKHTLFVDNSHPKQLLSTKCPSFVDNFPQKSLLSTKHTLFVDKILLLDSKNPESLLKNLKLSKSSAA